MKKLIATFIIVSTLTLVADEKPFVAYVNVGNALENTLLTDLTKTFLPGIMPVRVKVLSAANVDVENIMSPATPDKRFGESAKLFVYFVNDPKFPPQLTSPGRWAVINVRNLEKGADAAKFKARIQKMVLKGLAFACGFGANQDIGRCVMGAGSFDTLKGIDGTSASYSPFVAFPMMDFLSARDLLDYPTVE